MRVEELRSLFPALSQEVYGKRLVYFDNAATSQRPRQVLDRLSLLSSRINSNIHRAVHHLASEATDEFESARDCVKDFIGASEREEVVFTSGTTASINLVAYSFGQAFVHQGDEIIVAESEHHSDIVPWQLLCERKGATLKVLPVLDDGHLDVKSLETLISDKTRLLAVAQVSNVLGLTVTVDEIVKMAHRHDVPVLIDGAQGVVHQGVDVTKSDIDFYAFSGHKIFAASGTGVLYGKRKWLERMPPFMGGGEMIGHVRFSGTTYAPLPEKFEAGTQNINAVPTLKDALSLAGQIFRDKELMSEEVAVKEYLLDKLTANPRITLYGVPRGTSSEEKCPLFSFSVKGAHHEDLALILDKMGIAVRSGQMCAEPTMDRFGVTGMLRVSLMPYNTMEEAEYFMESLDKAIKMLV